MAGENRLSREMDTREKTTRRMEWKPPTVLPEPDHRPGLRHRWIRRSMLGQDDPKNMSSRLREGWVPVKLEDYPELKIDVTTNGKLPESGLVEIGGVILCAMPEEMATQRDAYFRQKAEAQTESVDHSYLKEQDARMPLFSERKSRSKFGKGASSD